MPRPDPNADRPSTKELFLAALDREGDARAEFLSEARARDAQRCERVERLLAAHEATRDDWTLGLSEVAGEALKLRQPAPAAGMRVGDYDLLEQLGLGASGVVWRARQVSLGRIVAVKLLRSGRSADPNEVARFRAEAETVARLDHPNIVPVYEVGEVDGRAFFSMRWVDGDDLADRVGEPWPPRRAADFMLTVARAVHHAHQRGLLHRDLKPSNILLSADGVPHVADFGVARRMDAAGSALGGTLVGTPLYMAPEQVDNEPELTVGTDVWALGCILFELLAGTPPFRGESVHEVFSKVREAEAGPWRAGSRPPRDLETIVSTCLRKRAGDRYASAAALADDLERWLAHAPIQARQVRSFERLALAWRRAPLTASLIAAVALLVLALAIGASWTSVLRERGLRESLLLAARATRLSAQPGRRAAALDLAVRAGALRAGHDVRDEVVASLALSDLRVIADWPVPERGIEFFSFDSNLERYAWIDSAGTVFVSRAGGTEAEVAVPSPAPADSVELSADGRVLFASYPREAGGHVRVWDLAANPATLLFAAPARPQTEAYGFSRDGALLAFATGAHEVVIVDLATREALTRLPVTGDVTCLEFSSDGSALALGAAGDDFVVESRALPAGRLIASSSVRASVGDLDWLHDQSALIVACRDGHAYRWTPGAGDPDLVLRGHFAELSRVRASPVSPLAATYSWDETLRLWDLRTGESVVTVDAMLGRFAADGRAVAFRSSERIGVLALEHETVLRVLVGHDGKNPQRVGFGAAGAWLWSAGSDGVRRWDLTRGHAAPLLGAGVTELVLFDDGDRCLCRVDGRLELRSLSNRAEPELVAGGPVEDVDGSRDGRVLAWRAEHALEVLHRAAPARRVAIPVDAAVRHADLSDDGRWLAAGTWGGYGVRLWDASTGECVATLFDDTYSASVAFSPDGDHLAVGLTADYVVLRRDTLREVCRIPRGRALARYGGPMAFDAGGRSLAVETERGVVAIHDVSTGAEQLRLEPPRRRPIGHLRFAPDGSRLALASWPQRILIWELGAIRRELAALGLAPGR